MNPKFASLILIFLFTCAVAHAQQREKFNPANDQRTLSGYTIHLVPMPLNTFGFNILKGNKPVYSQLSNPFSHSPLGFTNKDDAYKLAEWIVNETEKRGKPPVAIPASAANQLNFQNGSAQQ